MISQTKKYRTVILALSLLLMAPSVIMSQDTQPPVLMQRQRHQDPNKAKEQLALNYYRSHQFEKSAALYKELYDKSPRQYYYSYYFSSLINLKEFKLADRLVKQQLKRTSNNYRVLVDQIYVYDLMKNTKKSKKLLKELQQNLPENKSLIIQIASSLEAKGYFDEALNVYNKAQDMPGLNYDYNLEKAQVYLYTGNYDKMFDAYLQHLDLQPQDMQTIKNRMQSMMRRDVDDNLSNLLKKKLLEKAQSDPENQVYAELLLWHVMQTKDFEMAFRQARAMDMRFENREEDMLELADICFANQNYELSAKAFEYIKDKKEKTPFYLESYSGYYLSLVRLAEADPGTDLKSYKALKKTGEKAIDELGLSKGTVDIIKSMSHITAFHLNEFNESIAMLEAALEIGNLNIAEKSGLKLELADILMFKEKVWDATLLYSQIESDMKNEPIGHEAKFRNARLYYFIGEYDWALTKLDILKSATSRLISNDAIELSLFIRELYTEDTLGFTLKMFGKADMYSYRNKYDSALLWLEKIENDPGGINSYQHVVYKKAGLMIKKQDYQQADSLYNYLAVRYPESIKADNALFKRAEINRLYFENEEVAKSLYLKLMTDYPDSIYAGEGRKLFRMLRGEYPAEENETKTLDP